MSSTESHSDDVDVDSTAEIPIAIIKGKVAPITERYRGGGYVPVETEVDDVRRVAVCDLDGKHNRDYRVKYASDPRIIIEAEGTGVTHDQLREKLVATGLWSQGLRPIEVPAGTSHWRCGFVAPSRASGRLDWFKERISRVAIEDAPIREGDNSVSTFI